MEIGFVNFDQEALGRANKVMSMLRGQGAIDELGLGRIRNAFSNAMFPGISTLQTRAKYFLLLPALYSFLEHTGIGDAREAREKIREYEISLTKRMMEGETPENIKGIIGAESLRNNEPYVKYDPARVYKAGLETYGLVKSGGNVYQLITERSKTWRNIPQKYRNEEEGMGDSEDLNGMKPLFLTCGENYDFRSREKLSISLTHKEASFLRRQIILHTPGTLLSYLLENDLYTTATENDFETLEFKLKGIVPECLYRVYQLARRYSRFAYLLRIRYAMLYDKAVGAHEAANEEESEFFSFMNLHRSELTLEAVDEILGFVSSSVSEETGKIFCRKAARLIEEEKWDELDILIERREVEIKTSKRSKLRNAKDYEPGKSFEKPGMMSFRWNFTVRNILNEIREGIRIHE